MTWSCYVVQGTTDSCCLGYHQAIPSLSLQGGWDYRCAIPHPTLGDHSLAHSTFFFVATGMEMTLQGLTKQIQVKSSVQSTSPEGVGTTFLTLLMYVMAHTKKLTCIAPVLPGIILRKCYVT